MSHPAWLPTCYIPFLGLCPWPLRKQASSGRLNDDVRRTKMFISTHLTKLHLTFSLILQLYRECNYFLNYGPFSMNIYCIKSGVFIQNNTYKVLSSKKLIFQSKMFKVDLLLVRFRLLISTALTTTSLSLNHFSFFPHRKILVYQVKTIVTKVYSFNFLRGRDLFLSP